MKTVTGDPHEFVDAFERRYLSVTRLPRLCSVVDFDPDDPRHVDRGYSQIGVMTAFPVEVVERWEPGFVAREVVDGIESTELGYVAEALDSSGEVDVVELASPEELSEAAADRDLVHLLAPGGHTLLEELGEEGKLSTRSTDAAEVVELEDCDLEIHRHPGDGVFALQEDAVEVVQKHGEDAEPPGFPHFDEADFNYRRRLMVYFGSEIRRHSDVEYFDLLYRVVLSQPNIVGEAIEIDV